MASSLSSWFPSGRHFNPTDDELLVHLFNFVTGEPFSCKDSITIPTVDLYGNEEPWDLFSIYSSSSSQIKKKRDLYFYTRLKKKNQTKGKRVSRLIGKGCWHGQDCGKQIFYEGEALLGFKKSMVYQNKNNPTQDRQWLLKEYSLSDTVLDKIEKDNLIVSERKDYVLCRMRRKKPKKESEASNKQGVGDLSDLFSKFQEKISANRSPPIPHQEIEQQATTEHFLKGIDFTLNDELNLHFLKGIDFTLDDELNLHWV